MTDEEATAVGLLVAVRLCRFRENFMFNNPMGVGQGAGENIEAEFREEELDDIRKRAEGCLPFGGPAGSSSLGSKKKVILTGGKLGCIATVE